MDKDNPDEELALDSNAIEVTGHGSRAEWEDIYIKARELARKHGLSVDQFVMEPAEPSGERDVPESGPEAQGSASDFD